MTNLENIPVSRWLSEATAPSGINGRLIVTIHGCYPARRFYALAHGYPEAASAIWGRMLHICASRSVLLFTKLRFLQGCKQ